MILYGAAFTRRGAELLSQILARMETDTCRGFAARDYGKEFGLEEMHGGAGEFAKQGFAQADGLLFVGACGIAVRAVAPLLQGKDKDPAVVVIDEAGQYAISLLSGHLGGANRLTERIALAAGAQPVITTATDVRGVFAADSFAREQGCAVLNPREIRAISSALLEGKTVGIKSDFPLTGPLPMGLCRQEKGKLGIYLTLKGAGEREKKPFDTTLTLVPRILTLGIGCRRGVSADEVEQAVRRALSEAGIPLEAVERICSISLKEREGALIECARRWQVPFVTFTPQELAETPGQYAASSFVQSVTGVDNVCERAAVCGSGGRLLLRKTVFPGVTVAAAVRRWQGSFPAAEREKR